MKRFLVTILVVSLALIAAGLEAAPVSDVVWYTIVDGTGMSYELSQFASDLSPAFWIDDECEDCDSCKPGSGCSLPADAGGMGSFVPVFEKDGALTYLNARFSEDWIDPFLLMSSFDCPVYPGAVVDYVMAGFQNEGRFLVASYSALAGVPDLSAFYADSFLRREFSPGVLNDIVALLPPGLIPQLSGTMAQYGDRDGRNVFLMVSNEDAVSQCFVILTEAWPHAG
jgi:hypothetical protein